MRLNESFTLGQTVGIVGYDKNTKCEIHQGLYTISKINKVRTHLINISDGTERIFISRTGDEKGVESYSPFIIGIEYYHTYSQQSKRYSLWCDLEDILEDNENFCAIEKIESILQKIKELNNEIKDIIIKKSLDLSYLDKLKIK